MIWGNIRLDYRKECYSKMEEDEIPFDSGEPYIILDYKCKICGFEDKVPDFVAYESYMPEEFDEETGCPTIMCIKCDGVMIDKKYFENSERSEKNSRP